VITKAMILAHAATVGLTCTAVELAPPVYKAVKARVQGHHKPVVRHHRKPRVAAPVCPPSGIVTIGQMQNYTRPIVPIDTVGGTGVLQGAKQEGYGYGSVSNGRTGAFIGGGSIPSGGSGGSGHNPPQPPVVMQPTPSALPEPGTWAMMLAGFGMVGLAARVKTRRVGTANNVGE